MLGVEVGMCEVGSGGMHVTMGFGEAISNVTLEPKALRLDCRAESTESEGLDRVKIVQWSGGHGLGE